MWIFYESYELTPKTKNKDFVRKTHELTTDIKKKDSYKSHELTPETVKS